MSKKISYIGSKVFIGIDVHRKSYAVTAIHDGEMIKRWRMIGIPLDLVERLSRYFPDTELFSVYEAGFCGFVLHRTLCSAGINNIVVNPGSLEVAARDKVKTDRKDSLKLATHLSLGRLRGITVPSVQREQSRELSRIRTQQIRNRVRIMNQVRMKLHYWGLLPIAYVGVLKREFIGHIAVKQSFEVRLSLESLCAVWERIDTEIVQLDKALKEQAKTDKLEEVYRSVPGIGKVASRILSGELGDMSQFANERALFCFTGLTPMEFSSGDNRRLGHISRQGNSRLRAILVECAWVAIKKDPGLKKAFDRITIKAGKKRAIVAIARKLIGRTRAVMNKRTLYELEHEQAA